MYEQFGKYKIISVIGQGGMGKVYKAFDTELKRTVALKIVLSPDLQFLQRFIIEMQAVAKLNHTNIIKIFNMGSDNGVHFFTMEYIEGSDLTSFLHNNPQIDFKTRAVILSKIAFALHHCHAMGIIHRDLKPSNIMIRSNGQPVLMDFGLAKDQEKLSELTKTGELLGTPFYMSPEQILGKNKSIDERSDIFALGIIMYEMFTGKIPYKAQSMSGLLVEITEEKITTCRKVNNSIPKDLSKICEKATQKNIQHRYQNAQCFARDLRNYSRNKKIKIHLTSSINTYIKATILIVLLLTTFVFYQKTNGKKNTLPSVKISHIQNPFQEAKYLYQQRLYEECYDKLQKILLAKSTNRDNVYEYLVYTCVEIGEHQKALSYCSKISENKHNKQPLVLAKAKIAYFKENYAKARSFLQKITENISAETLWYKGLIEFATSNYNLAIDFLHQASSKENPPLFTANVQHLLGKSYYFQGNFSKAITFLEASLPFLQQRDTYEYIARCYLEKQKYHEAKKVIKRGWKLGRQNGEYLTLYAEILEKQDKIKAAREVYIKALRSEVTNTQALEGVLRCYLQKMSFRDTNLNHIFVYFNALTQKSSLKASPFFQQYQALAKKYAPYHFERLHLQKNTQSPHLLLKKLASTNQQIYKLAIKGLIALRYQKNIEKNISMWLDKIREKPLLYKNVKHTLDLIHKKKKQEKKYIAFYYIAKCQLEDLTTNSSLHDFVDDEVLLQIFNDKEADDLIRYLSTKCLVKRLHFDLLEKNQNSDDHSKKIICNIFLHTEKIKSFSLKQIKECSPFLTSKVARIAKHPLRLAFLKNPHLIVRVSAATILLREKSPPLSKEDKEECIQTIVDCFRSEKANYRRYIHFSFWRLKLSVSLKDYVDHFVAGCNDIDPYVQLSTLKNYNRLHSSPEFMNAISSNKAFVERICDLLSNNHDFTTRVLAGLWLQKCDPENKLLQEIVSNLEEVFFIRFIFTLGVDSTQFSIGGAMVMMRKISHLLTSPDPLLRAAAYLLGAVLGQPVVKYLKKEQDLRLKANLLTSYRVKRIIGFVPRNIQQEYIKAAKKYRNHKNANIRTAAVAAEIALSSPKRREYLSQKLLKNKDPHKKRGAALGYYSLISQDLNTSSLTKGKKAFTSQADEYNTYALCEFKIQNL
ncbi:protein kinase [Candidatus Uabimicrobium sp. HlEnr_7]|uniref:protein kinase domain-containing protein n=1 Tax=Candidatus Uabimicrobium helgolandensis TaxID=3095367 RepID=UPI003555D379